MRWQALLIDIDGVLHVDSIPVPGAREALAQLRSSGIGFRLVTNTTSKSRRLVTENLRLLGFEIDQDEILTPAALAVAHCRERGYTRVALHVAPQLREDFELLGDATEEEVEAVVLGDLGAEFTYERLNVIFRQLLGGAEFIALQRNRVWQRKDGLVLDAGPYVAALEYGADISALLIGKPSGEFFAAALAELGVDAAHAAMIGDDIEADIGGALSAGLDGVLVQTGKFRPQTTAASPVVPTATIPSIGEFTKLLYVNGD